MSKHTAFISFDGLSDPLGQSQILPYILGLAKQGYVITLFSCEKPGRLSLEKDQLQLQLQTAGITWQYLLYDEAGGFASRLDYISQLKKMVLTAHKQKAFSLCHCRSYLAAEVGLWLKRKQKLPFLFDMRGFWADERIDGGIWKKTNPLHFSLYMYFKYKEKLLVKHAAAIISLTERAKQELLRKFKTLTSEEKITVIPCCTNTALFDPENTKAATIPCIPADAPYIVYAGSIGTWYYTNEVIACFEVWKKQLPNLHLLLLTKDTEAASALLQARLLDTKNNICILSASHKEVPGFLKNALAAIFFIKPAYSKIASSPTKMAECWAMDLPIITNSGIGDNDLFFTNFDGGVLLNAFNDAAYEQAYQNFTTKTFSKNKLRNIALTQFDHAIAIARYSKVYGAILNNGL